MALRVLEILTLCGRKQRQGLCCVRHTPALLLLGLSAAWPISDMLSWHERKELPPKGAVWFAQRAPVGEGATWRVGFCSCLIWIPSPVRELRSWKPLWTAKLIFKKVYNLVAFGTYTVLCSGPRSAVPELLQHRKAKVCTNQLPHPRPLHPSLDVLSVSRNLPVLGSVQFYAFSMTWIVYLHVLLSFVTKCQYGLWRQKGYGPFAILTDAFLF